MISNRLISNFTEHCNEVHTEWRKKWNMLCRYVHPTIGLDSIITVEHWPPFTVMNEANRVQNYATVRFT